MICCYDREDERVFIPSEKYYQPGPECGVWRPRCDLWEESEDQSSCHQDSSSWAAVALTVLTSVHFRLYWWCRPENFVVFICRIGCYQLSCCFEIRLVIYTWRERDEFVQIICEVCVSFLRHGQSEEHQEGALRIAYVRHFLSLRNILDLGNLRGNIELRHFNLSKLPTCPFFLRIVIVHIAVLCASAVA